MASNQSGAARGYFSLERVYVFHTAMDATVQAEGGRVDSYAICLHLINGAVAGYVIHCDSSLEKRFQLNSRREPKIQWN